MGGVTIVREITGHRGPPSLTLRARNTFAARRWGLTGEVSAGLLSAARDSHIIDSSEKTDLGSPLQKHDDRKKNAV
jgi:hypothetical protein